MSRRRQPCALFGLADMASESRADERAREKCWHRGDEGDAIMDAVAFPTGNGGCTPLPRGTTEAWSFMESRVDYRVLRHTISHPFPTTLIPAQNDGMYKYEKVQ